MVQPVGVFKCGCFGLIKNVHLLPSQAARTTLMGIGIDWYRVLVSLTCICTAFM